MSQHEVIADYPRRVYAEYDSESATFSAIISLMVKPHKRPFLDVAEFLTGKSFTVGQNEVAENDGYWFGLARHVMLHLHKDGDPNAQFVRADVDTIVKELSMN